MRHNAKIFWICFTLLLNSPVVAAGDGAPTVITTLDEKTYKGVRIQEVAADGIIFSYQPEGGGMGTAKVKFDNLPDDLQRRYGYDARKAAALEPARLKQIRQDAEDGDMSAQYILGVAYLRGELVPRNNAEAVKWFRKAAEQGLVEAQTELAGCYASGQGVKLNHAEAVKWWLRAAKQGDGESQLYLAMWYRAGQGVPTNSIEAYKWAKVAAMQNVSKAHELLDSFSISLTSEMIAEGKRQASQFVATKEGDLSGPKSALSKDTKSVGSGFFVTDDGYLLTCNHVVRGATSFRVKTTTGTMEAKVVKSDSKLDLALLKVSGTFHGLALVPESVAKLGAPVFTIGFPNPQIQGEEPKLTRGEISGLAGMRDNPRSFQISVPVQPGNSGGALADEWGNVVGVIKAQLDDVATYLRSGSLPQNVNYAVKSGLVYKFLNETPELSGKLKAPRTLKDREAATAAVQQAAVLIIVE